MHPVLFQIGDLTIRSYGLLLALAFLAGLALALHRAPQYGVDRRRVVHALALVLVSVLIGARIHYVADHAASYASDPWRVLRVSEGGLNMYGGAFLAALALLVYARRASVSFTRLGALFAMPLALGEAITRIGCFLNGCCFGLPCHRPWAVVFPPQSAAGLVSGGTPLHPTQLYTAGASLGIFVLLLVAERARARAGVVVGAFLVSHGLMRFLVEGYRYHAPTVLSVSFAGASYTSAELVSLGLIALGLTGMWRSACGVSARPRTESSSNLSRRRTT